MIRDKFSGVVRIYGKRFPQVVSDNVNEPRVVLKRFITGRRQHVRKEKRHHGGCDSDNPNRNKDSAEKATHDCTT